MFLLGCNSTGLDNIDIIIPSGLTKWNLNSNLSLLYWFSNLENDSS